MEGLRKQLSVIDESGAEVEVDQDAFWQYGLDALPVTQIVDMGNLPHDEWIKGENDD